MKNGQEMRLVRIRCGGKEGEEEDEIDMLLAQRMVPRERQKHFA